MTTERATDALAEAAWFKSSYSATDAGQCVEVALGARLAGVRDSKFLGGPVQLYRHEAWGALVSGLKGTSTPSI
ncbi:DUF397 domain-containing protein [Yinghuangia soli]|uniref:DUF397 domain-containing protein n=1 Tax=Yinghuangia soli TaxID=2908204 RepID=A0AA41PXV2_9ACTN|nr:DUF397 domain-containing protein [Yinghuangia soli]MCF2527869.1 DUF397 domain-containing protein [Yinghuangia soli]